MRERKARRIGKTIRRSMHDLGDHRERLHGSRADAWREEKIGKIGWGPVSGGRQGSMQTAGENITRADIMMGGHYQMRQQRELVAIIVPPGETMPFTNDPIGTFCNEAKLRVTRALGATVGQIDDLALCRAVDSAMRLIDEVFKFR